MIGKFLVGNFLVSSFTYKKLQDRVTVTDNLTQKGSSLLNFQSLQGTWQNTNTNSQGIVKVILAVKNDQLTIQVFGAEQPTLQDWGIVAVDDVYSSSISSQQAISYTAQYQFDFKDVELQVNLSKGLMIISAHHVFHDGSGRANYFCREFFQKID